MTVIQQNRYDQLLRRVADLKGPGSKVNDALTELFPMMDVENVPAELLLLMGSRLCMGGQNLGTPGVALFNQGMLRNPGGSGAIITVLDIHASTGTSQRLVWGPTLNTLANDGVSAFVDTRIFGEGTVGQILEEPLLVPGATFAHTRLRSDTDFHIEVPRGLAVLGPGTAFSISTATADTNFSFSFTWLERVAQPSELNL